MNADAKTCWDFWNCSKKERQLCPVFQTNSGNTCWMMTKKFEPQFRTAYSTCIDCPWFKKHNPGF